MCVRAPVNRCVIVTFFNDVFYVTQRNTFIVISLVYLALSTIQNMTTPELLVISSTD